MSGWVVTSDNGETNRRNELLAEGWEPFSVVGHAETSQWGAWTEIWFRRRDITAQEPQRITHGRHCTCSACAREDWTNPALAPCGMHGPSCPREYQPWGAPGTAAQEPPAETVQIISAAREFRCHGCGRIPLGGTFCSEPCSRCGGVYVIDGDECGSCIERIARDECPKSKRWCGHHCNHVLTQDACDWCGGHYEEDEWVAQEPPAECGNCHGKGVHRTPGGRLVALILAAGSLAALALGWALGFHDPGERE